MATEPAPYFHWILAIDPGVTSGICTGYLDLPRNQLTLKPSQVKGSFGQMYGEIMRHIAVREEMHTHIIYEDFNYRNNPRTGLNLMPVKLIGVIELLQEFYERPTTTFYKQSAATGKSFFRDDRLKSMGIYPVGLEHGRDAMRHLLQWLAFGAGSQYAKFDDLEVKLG